MLFLQHPRASALAVVCPFMPFSVINVLHLSYICVQLSQRMDQHNTLHFYTQFLSLPVTWLRNSVTASKSCF